MFSGLAKLGIAVSVAALAACSPTGPTGAVGMGDVSPGAGTVTMRWEIQDGCSDGLGLSARFFDQSESTVWPNASDGYTSQPAGTVDRLLSCTPGHKICYGAQPFADGSTFYWGVGLHNDKGCDTCCVTCAATSVSRRLTC